MKNKKNLLVAILILSLIIITAGITYAFFNYVREGSTENVITTGSITFIYTEVDQVGAGISLEDAYPMSDSQGKVQSGSGKVFNFKVKSTTPNANISYEVTARKKTESNLPEEAVRIYLTEVTGEDEKQIVLDNYSNLLQTEKITEEQHIEKTLYKGTVYAADDNYEKNFRLRMWVDEDIDFSPVKDEEGNVTYPYNDKIFTVTVNVYANAKVVTEDKVSLENNTEIKNVLANDIEFDNVENEEYDYEVVLPNGTKNTTLEVYPENENAKVTIEKLDNVAYNSNIRRLASIDVFELKTGSNYFKVTVTSENNKNKKEFILNIEVEKENINTLENIEVKGYELTPDFDKEVTTYEVITEEESLEILTEKTSTLSTVTIIGNDNLSWGSNEISIMVTAENGEVQMYKIAVTNTQPTAPTITGGSDSWVQAAPTISVSKAGSAVSGLKHYEYYKSTSGNEPTDDINPTGTTSGNLTISDEGTTYIWYRTVSNNGFKSKWSNQQVVKLDTGTPSAPTITGGSTSWSPSAKTISVSKASTATSGINYYQYCISTSTSSCNGSWTNLASGVTSVSISTNGTRYIFFRAVSGSGKTGAVSAAQTTMVDTGTPSAPTLTGGSTSWSSSAKTISVQTASTATSGISYYQYCISTSTSSCNGSWTNLASGVTSVSISTNGTRYIFFRAVNNANTPGTASGYQTTMVDTGTPSAPTITGGSTSWSPSVKTISVQTASTATSGISYYQYCISTSTSSCNGSWTNLASGTKSVSISTNGTRYIFFRAVSGSGKTGTVSAAQTTKIDTGTPGAATITAWKSSAATSIASGVWSNEWISYSISGSSATSGISYYQYCTDTTNTCTPNKTLTGNSHVESSQYIRYRAVSGSGKTGTIAAYQALIDTTIPTVSYNLAGGTYTTTKTVTVTGSDTNFSYMNVHVYKDGVMQSAKSVTSRTSNTFQVALDSAGTWTVYAQVYDKAGNKHNQSPDNGGGWYYQNYTISLCAYKAGQTWNYGYTGGVQSFTVPCSGTYKLEVWGAQGGYATSTTFLGGYGGYSYGNKSLGINTPLYIVIGGSGANSKEGIITTYSGGYNGGGNGYVHRTTNGSSGAGGGGATHIATTNRGILANYASYKSEVLIVAGGGGGAFSDTDGNGFSGKGGSGGGSSGGSVVQVNNSCNTNCNSYNYPSGGTQSSGGLGVISWSDGATSSTQYVGTFGKGGIGQETYGGGGGGWYGGASGQYTAGGGGSGYIGGVTGGAMQNGVRSGHGYATITLVSISQ